MVDIITATPPQRVPRPALVEIANLRIRVPRLADTSIVPVATVPVTSARPRVPALPPIRPLLRLLLARTEDHPAPPAITARPGIPQLPVFTPPRLPSFANTDVLDRVIARSDEAGKRDAERRKREDEMIARVAREARAVAEQERTRRQLSENVAASKPRKSAWQQARDQREQAMKEWDAVDRLDGAGLERPGRQIPRPSRDRDAAAQPIVRRFPRLPGQGIGD